MFVGTHISCRLEGRLDRVRLVSLPFWQSVGDCVCCWPVLTLSLRVMVCVCVWDAATYSLFAKTVGSIDRLWLHHTPCCVPLFVHVHRAISRNKVSGQRWLCVVWFGLVACPVQMAYSLIWQPHKPLYHYPSGVCCPFDAIHACGDVIM